MCGESRSQKPFREEGAALTNEGRFDRYLICTFEDCRIGIPIEHVERVVEAVAVTRLDDSAETVLGVVDYRGTIIPVYSARRRLGYEQRPIRAADKYVIVHTPLRSSALCVDRVDAVKAIPSDSFATYGASDPDSLRVHGIVRSDDGLVVVLDMDRFLDPQDESRLRSSIESLENGQQ